MDEAFDPLDYNNLAKSVVSTLVIQEAERGRKASRFSGGIEAYGKGSKRNTI